MKLALNTNRPGIDLGDPELRLTPSQQRACQLGQEILVTAGAGSGKTHTLSLRYVLVLFELALDSVESHPVDPRPDIQRVLVLTFTERAAQEMAQRCYERLLDLSAACRAQAAELRHLYGNRLAAGLPLAITRMIDRFDEARISTFHGFCARLHADYPGPCHTPPETRVAEANEAQRLLRHGIDEALSEFSGSSGPDLRLLMGTFGSHQQLLEAVGFILGQRSRLSGFLHSCASGERDVKQLVDRAPMTAEDVNAWLSDFGVPCLERIATAVAPSGGGEGFQDRIAPILDRVRQVSVRPLEAYRAYQLVLDAVVNENGVLRTLTHHSIVGTKAAWPQPEERAQALTILREIGEECSDWPTLAREARFLPNPADESMLSVLQALSRLVLLAREHYEEALRGKGLLDFEALQQRAVDAVLRHPEVADDLQNRHRYIMVDEFQDTDAAQWQLVLKLGRPRDLPSDRIFLVGDAKQAIYGFRGGDVTVFQAAARELRIEPICFPENFRSRTELIDWLNPFFAQVLGAPAKSRPDWEAAHQPLIAARGECQGTVRLLTHQEPPGPSAAALEATGIAAFLVNEVFAENGLAARATEETACPEVAILLRARTHLFLFEEALRAVGIPFQVGGGVGFWSREEVVDMVNVLHALATEDQVSLVGALRGPLFGLSDDEVHALSIGRWGANLSNFGVARLGHEAPERLRAVEEAWRGLKLDRHRLPWPMLLRAILERTYAAHAFEIHGGARARANIQRLVSIADREAANGLTSLREASIVFLENVLRMEREAEAAPESQQARVSILTIHASKGLEFPIVILPGLESSSPVMTTPVLAQRIEGELELACRVEDREAAVQSRATPGSWYRLANQRDLEEDAERRRLLYVAATRTRDHLVLVGGRSRINRAGDSWMHMLAQHHGDDFQSIDSSPLETADPTLLDRPPIPREAELVEPAPPVLERIRLSPSGIDLFKNCPARWYRRTCLGVPEPRRFDDPFPEATTRGLVLHALLEHNLQETDEEAARLWGILASEAGGSAEEVERGEKTLMEHLQRCRDSELLNVALSADGYNEIAFSIEHGPFQVSGVIDRLWKDPTSEQWCVLDHKSGSAKTDGDPAGQESAFEAQLAAYAWASEHVLKAQAQGPIGRRCVFSTLSGEMSELSPWGQELREAFLALLEEMAEFATSDWEQVQQKALHKSRPCSDCGYWKRGCSGENSRISP